MQDQSDIINGAEEMGMDMVAPCAACYKNMNKASHVLREDPNLLSQINATLDDHQVRQAPSVRHPVDVVVNDVGVDNVPVEKPLNGLKVASAYIESGRCKKALVIGSEKLSSIANYKDRNTCVLFGDAAGAVVLEPSTNGSGIQSTYLKSDGTMRELLWMKTGGTKNPIEADFAYDGSDKIYMNGAEVFKVAGRQKIFKIMGQFL